MISQINRPCFEAVKKMKWFKVAQVVWNLFDLLRAEWIFICSLGFDNVISYDNRKLKKYRNTFDTFERV